MIARLIEWCVGRRALVVAATLALAAAGAWAMRTTPLDAIPDLSDVQIIVSTEWSGRSPDLVEDQITYPIVSALLSAPGVRTVRAVTELGVSSVYVIFDDGVDLYWARSRVVEYLQGLGPRLPSGVVPTIGPDATGVGWVYQYALVDESGGQDLASLRSWQDWHLRPLLAAVPGVAEVASIGGFVKQYHVSLDPGRLAVSGISIQEIVGAIRASTGDVEGRLLEFAGREFTVRSRGTLRTADDIARIALRADTRGTPLRVGDVAEVRLGPEIRRGAADLDGRGEAVGGIVVMRTGGDTRGVIARVQAALDAAAASLPPGVRVVPTYDRSTLIDAAIGTFRRTLIEEAVVVSVVILLFLGHLRSALVPILALPVAVVCAFLPMRALGVSANIMSLGGLALAVGVLVDAAIVMVENAHRRLSEPDGGQPFAIGDQPAVITRAAVQVARPIFFSLLIIVVSFVPVFLLESREGRLFRPLALAKTSAMVFASMLSITLVPVLMTMLMRGARLRPESGNPVARLCTALYAPVLRFSLRWRWAVLAINFAIVPLTVPLALSLGSEFMPPLYEGALLYMPTSPPGLSITEATRVMQIQDRLLRGIPEVARVFGTLGRGTSATDNSPMGMVNTTVLLAPRHAWRPGVTVESLQAEMDAALQFPGFPNVWTQPIRGRLDMLSTGMKTALGIKVSGPDLDVVQRAGARIAAIVAATPGARGAYAELVAQGAFTDIEIDRDAIARHGLRLDDVQQTIEAAVGGTVAAQTVEGRERYGIQVRYARDFRDDHDALARVLVATPGGGSVPLGSLARIVNASGPAMIRDEDGRLTGYVYIDIGTNNVEGFVAAAGRAIGASLELPPGYRWEWSGDYEMQQRAWARLRVLIPAALAFIFALLCATFGSGLEAGVVMLSVVYAMTGGVIAQWLLGYHFSVAVWVGYIALFGVAVQTGVVMVMYLQQALEARTVAGHPPTDADIQAAALDGSILRLRPKLMTVTVVLASLVPLFWSDGIGTDVMRPIAAPIIGGMVTSAIHVLIVTPVVFVLMQQRRRRAGTGRAGSGDADSR